MYFIEKTNEFDKWFRKLKDIRAKAKILFRIQKLQNEELSFYKNVTVNGLDWIHPLGIKFAFGVDGISILMVTLTSFIVLLALIASKNTIRQKHKFYYALVFLLQCSESYSEKKPDQKLTAMPR